MLYLIPVIRYHMIKSKLTIKDVSGFEHTFRNVGFDDIKYRHTILDFLLEGSTILLRTDGMILRIKDTGESTIEIEDKSLPSGKCKVTDFGGAVIKADVILAELEPYKIDA